MLNLVDNKTFVIALILIGALANFITIPVNILNLIKRVLGGLWISLACVAEYFLVSAGSGKMSAATGPSAAQTITQWITILIIFTIVMVGFFIYGVYGATGQYDRAEGA